VFDPASSSILYAGTESGIYRTTDAGTSWIALASFGTSSVRALALDPSEPGTVYCALEYDFGVLRSRDAGASWTRMKGIGAEVTSLVVDPGHPSVVYAGSARGVFRNRGGKWFPLNTELASPFVRALAIDPAGDRLHAGTLGGAFDYELSGAPCAPLDLVCLLSSDAGETAMETDPRGAEAAGDQARNANRRRSPRGARRAFSWPWEARQ
jgi:photosystem II stability/assembly factor-like uncharacterized protein